MTKEEFDKLYKKTEGKLFNYKKIIDDIDIIQLEIDRVNNEYLGCAAINYNNEKTGVTYNISNSVENETIRKEQRINYLEYKKKELEIEKKKIDIAISNFTIQEKELFEMLYFNKNTRMSRTEILNKMHINKNTFYKLRKSLVISAINSIYPKILIDEIYNKMAN